MSKIVYDPESSVGYLIYRIDQRMHAFFRSKLDEEGVNVVETWILLQILNGVQTSHKLHKVLKIDMAQIQRACDKLVKHKLIQRSLDPHDRRVKILLLTQEGEILIKKLIKRSKTVNIEALSHLNENRKEELRQLLLEVLKGPFFAVEEEE